ncbi:hypothetical protein OSTOST_08088, partial [Ostertagia ostertagi]
MDEQVNECSLRSHEIGRLPCCGELLYLHIRSIAPLQPTPCTNHLTNMMVHTFVTTLS